MARFSVIKVFFDSSVLVAACASETGASAYLLGLCKQKKIQGFVSLDSIGEARKNVNLKLGKVGKTRLIAYLKLANLILTSSPTPEEIAECERAIFVKDAPILAAAIKSSVLYLVTLDRKHFFQAKVIKFAELLKIITPGELLKLLREKAIF